MCCYKSSWPTFLSAFRVVTWIPHHWSPASGSLTFQYSSNHHCTVRVCVCVHCACMCVCVCGSREKSCTCCSVSEDSVKVRDEVSAPGDQSHAMWLVPKTHSVPFVYQTILQISHIWDLFYSQVFIDLFIKNTWRLVRVGRCTWERTLQNDMFASSQVETFYNMIFPALKKKNNHFFSLSLFAERLYNSNGRDLRRALFSLKQIFQVTDTYFTCNYCQCVVAEYSWLLWSLCASTMTGISINVASLSLCVYLCGCV